MSRNAVPTENVSPEELFVVMCGAATQDPVQIRASEQRLKSMLQMRGTFDALYAIASQRDVPLHVRQQSIIQFKNAVKDNWRSRKLLSDEQRVRIRARTLTLLDEGDDTIAECNEVIIARISRLDFPTNWPTLISGLMDVINSALQERSSSAVVDPRSALMLRRSLKVLDEVLKELSNIKMLGGVHTMGGLVAQLCPLLATHYTSLASDFASTLNGSSISSHRMAEDLVVAHLVYKCLVKMHTWAWQKITQNSHEHLEPGLREFFQNSAVQLKGLCEVRMNIIMTLRASSTPPDAITIRAMDYLTRHVRLFGKLFRRMQQLHATRFVTLPLSSDLILYYWSKVVQASTALPEFIADSKDAVFPVRFLVQAMVLFKEALAQWTPLRKNGTENVNVLSKEFVEEAVLLLVTRFIPLNRKDLAEWESDPEEWVNVEDKENDQWEYEVRACAERVLMTLAGQYKQYVTPLLEITLKRAMGQPTVDFEGVIDKEALYCAMGRCAVRLKDAIPFEQWLEYTWASEVQETNLTYPILKRRIAWVIGKWVSDQCSSPNNARIWEILVHLIQDRGANLVVRLTAAAAFRECVDTVDFDASIFSPFLASAVTELVRLLIETDTSETKRRVALSLNAIIERAETRIVPFIDIVTGPLPQLWNTAGTDYLFKSSLLETVSKLIDSSKQDSPHLGAIVVPLIRESFSSEAMSFLDEDGLNLWISALRNGVTIESVNGAPALVDLVPIAVGLLAQNMDLLGKIMSIVEAYLLLDATRVVQGCAVELFGAFVHAMSQPVPELNLKDMVVTLSLLVQIASPTSWAEAMHISGLFAYMLKLTIDDERGKTLLLTEHIYFYSRIALADPQTFLRLMSATAMSQQVSESSLYEGLLDQWWAKFDNMSEPRHRKLAAMGIACLVSTGRPEVLQRLSTEICNLWLDVFGEVKEALADISNDASTSPISASPLTMFWRYGEQTHTDFFRDTQDTLEYKRRKDVLARDPVQAVKLSTFIDARLREAQIACGGSQVFESVYLAKADSLVLKQIQAELVANR